MAGGRSHRSPSRGNQERDSGHPRSTSVPPAAARRHRLPTCRPRRRHPVLPPRRRPPSPPPPPPVGASGQRFDLDARAPQHHRERRPDRVRPPPPAGLLVAARLDPGLVLVPRRTTSTARSVSVTVRLGSGRASASCPALLIVVAIGWFVVRRLPQIHLELTAPDTAIWRANWMAFAGVEIVFFLLHWQIEGGKYTSLNYSTLPGWALWASIVFAAAVGFGGYLEYRGDRRPLFSARTPRRRAPLGAGRGRRRAGVPWRRAGGELASGRGASGRAAAGTAGARGRHPLAGPLPVVRRRRLAGRVAERPPGRPALAGRQPLVGRDDLAAAPGWRIRARRRTGRPERPGQAPERRQLEGGGGQERPHGEPRGTHPHAGWGERCGTRARPCATIRADFTRPVHATAGAPRGRRRGQSRAEVPTRSGRRLARAGSNPPPAARGRGSLRPPDQPVEPQDARLHLHVARSCPHHRPGQDPADAGRGLRLRPRAGVRRPEGALRRHQEAGPGRHRGGLRPHRSALRGASVDGRDAHQLLGHPASAQAAHRAALDERAGRLRADERQGGQRQQGRSGTAGAQLRRDGRDEAPPGCPLRHRLQEGAAGGQRGQQARHPHRGGGRHQLRPRPDPARRPRQRRRHPLLPADGQRHLRRHPRGPAPAQRARAARARRDRGGGRAGGARRGGERGGRRAGEPGPGGREPKEAGRPGGARGRADRWPPPPRRRPTATEES